MSRIDHLHEANLRINTALDGIGAGKPSLDELARIAHQLRVMEHHIRARLAHVEALMRPLLEDASTGHAMSDALPKVEDVLAVMDAVGLSYCLEHGVVRFRGNGVPRGLPDNFHGCRVCWWREQYRRREAALARERDYGAREVEP